jgi:plastocyanin
VAGSASNTAEAAAPPTKLLSPAGVGSVAALDAVSEPQALKIVGTARQIGVNTTLYEIAPGDTVTLTEIMSVNLGAVVVTGMPTARTADKSAEKSVTTQAAKTAVAPAVSASDGVTTISWTDPVTRNAMKLSGRISPARLQQVKAQIERERAAEAAKKKP